MDPRNYSNLKNYLETLIMSENWSPSEKHHLQHQSKQYFIHQNKIYYKNHRKPNQPLRLVQENEIETILYNMHTDPSSAHLEKKETIQRTLEYYFWPYMQKDIRQYVESYDNCQKREETRPTEPLNPIKVGQPFDRCLDFDGAQS
ncbi:hypothetical protein G9A89_012230 [Geosiphon pyriformis]|nr:hypothetical protein G9A89_012230 [Geosiphon pyriformis]